MLGSGQQTSLDLATLKWHPANRETADHSMPYTAAVALKYGTVEAQHFAPEYWQDPGLLELVQKVQVSVSDEANRRAPEAMLSIVEVVTSSGQRLTGEVAYHRGHYKNPMGDQEIEAKFRALAQGLLTSRQIDALLDRLWHLEQVRVLQEGERPRAGHEGLDTRSGIAVCATPLARQVLDAFFALRRRLKNAAASDRCFQPPDVLG
ncbi:MAG: hypothetical protein EHM35_10155 [Planctomycetaceae bacterium]|nr:MAG: hypothetical protein EHM35_10155 [Planctomycetaceae bacterium]